MKTRKAKMAKWKVYSALIALVAAVSFGFTVLTTFVTYPTDAHRKVAQELSVLDKEAFSSNKYEKIMKSDKYKDLANSRENVYTIRMGIASGILSAIISVAIVVALYRYLRRYHITAKPVGATVLIDTVATAIVMLPAMYIGELLTGIKTDPLMMIMLLIGVPFAVAFSALITFVIAKITEWHYNRSHGFIEE